MRIILLTILFIIGCGKSKIVDSNSDDTSIIDAYSIDSDVDGNISSFDSDNDSDSDSDLDSNSGSDSH